MLTEIRQSAREVYDAGGATMRNVWMGESEDAIRLFFGEVIENDSPVMGRDDEKSELDGKPWHPFEPLGNGIVLRKRLSVSDVSTREVWLAFVGRETGGNQAVLRILVNGNETLRPPSSVATPDAVQYYKMNSSPDSWNWSRWYYVQIPAEHIRPGENVIEISTVDGAEGWDIMVGKYSVFHKGARRGDYPEHASVKSTDGGAHTAWTQWVSKAASSVNT